MRTRVKLLALAGAGATLLLGLVLLAPLLADVAWARARLQPMVAQAVGGKVSWDALSARLLPRPAARVRGLRIETRALHARAEEAGASLALWPLLLGRVEIADIALVRPRLALTPREGGEPAAGAVDARHVVAALRELLPDATLRMQNAAFDLELEDLPPVALRAVSGQAKTGAEGATLEIVATSDAWRRLRAEATLSYADLALRVKGQAEGVQGTKALEFARRWTTEVKSASGAADVRLERLALHLDRPGDIDYQVVVLPKRLVVESDRLPASLQAEGGELTVGPQGLRFERVNFSLLDAAGEVSGRFGYRGPQVEASIAGGVLGEKAARWAVERAGAPRYEPRTPLRFTAGRIAWQPDRPLEVAASLAIDNGPRAEVEVAWKPALLELTRLTLEDGQSKLALAVQVSEARVRGRFSGAVNVDTLSALLQHALPGTGRLEGDYEFIVDRRDPLRSTAQGQLKGGNFDLEWLAGRALRIERLDVRGPLVEAHVELCGIALPLSAELVAGGVRAKAQIAANALPLEQTLRCLGQSQVELKGRADLRAELSTRGANREQWLENLGGSVRAEAKDGEVGKFDLLGRILSMRNFDDIGGLLQNHRDARGLRYRSFTLHGRFREGQFRVDESVFDSDAVRLVSSGPIGIAKPDTRLTVLVGVLGQVDRVVAAIPLIGRMLGGTLLALPVGVHGDIRDPLVVPLDPLAVGDRLVGILVRTVKLPVDLVKPSKRE